MVVEESSHARSVVIDEPDQGAPARGIAAGIALSLCFWIPLGLAIWSWEADATTTISRTRPPLPEIRASYLEGASIVTGTAGSQKAGEHRSPGG